jgi:hypothetical protein
MEREHPKCSAAPMGDGPSRPLREISANHACKAVMVFSPEVISLSGLSELPQPQQMGGLVFLAGRASTPQCGHQPFASCFSLPDFILRL